jgi:O-antigen ligase
VTQALAPPPDRLGRWCGWVLAGVALLTPLMAWLGPLGFAVLVALAGLLCLPALRVREDERLIAILLLGLVAWAAISSFWSPFRPDGAEESVALKLGLQIPLYWSAWQAARRVDPVGRRRASVLFAWGLALLGGLLLVEAFSGAAVYRGLRELIQDPIREDLGRKNVAEASFVLALLWPVAAAGGVRAGAPGWLAVPMAAGAALLAQTFLSDAPVLAVGLAILAGAAVWVWPKAGALGLAALAAAATLLMPWLVAGLRLAGLADGLPESWAQRMGYWIFARARIGEHPWQGWGLDASRTFAPNIQLHPHNGPLQLWLELGALGAVGVAMLWILVLRRLSGYPRSLTAAGAAASAMVYLLFGAISFGVWQEWWLALGALVAVIYTLAQGLPAEPSEPADT